MRATATSDHAVRPDCTGRAQGALLQTTTLL